MRGFKLADVNEFPVWELVVYGTMIMLGIRGLFWSGTAALALGSVMSVVWYVVLIVVPLIAIVALFTRPPNGLFIMITCMLIILVMSVGVYAGLVYAFGNPLFTGAASLIIFMIGSFARIVQSFLHLGRLQASLTMLKEVANSGNGVDRPTSIGPIGS